MGAANAEPGYDPAVEPIGNRGQKVVQTDKCGFVQFVEVKAIPDPIRDGPEFFGEGIGRGLPIKRPGEGEACGGGQDADQGYRRGMEKRRRKLLRKRKRRSRLTKSGLLAKHVLD